MEGSFLPSLEGPIHTKKDRTQKINKAAKVLATRLSNQWRRIRTWHYGVVFVQQKRSLFYQEDQLISRISYSKDKKPQQKQETINHVWMVWTGPKAHQDEELRLSVTRRSPPCSHSIPPHTGISTSGGWSPTESLSCQISQWRVWFR